MASKLALPGGYVNTYGGPVDEYYYLRLDETTYRPYASVEEACENVPVSFRAGRTVSVNDVEYIWYYADTSDSGLVEKTTSSDTSSWSPWVAGVPLVSNQGIYTSTGQYFRVKTNIANPAVSPTATTNLYELISDPVIDSTTAGLFKSNNGTSTNWSAAYPANGTVIRRAGSSLYYATMQAAVSAAVSGDVLEVYGIVSGSVTINKTLTIRAHNALFTDLNGLGGVIVGFGTPTSITVTWDGGRILGRLFLARGSGKVTARLSNLDVGTATSFVQVYALGYNASYIDEFELVDSRIGYVNLQQRSDSDQVQALYFNRCSLGTGADVPLFTGLVHPNTLLTLHDCLVRAGTTAAVFTTTNVNSTPTAVKLRAAVHATKALPAYQPNSISDGWLVTQAVNAFISSSPDNWYPSVSLPTRDEYDVSTSKRIQVRDDIASAFSATGRAYITETDSSYLGKKFDDDVTDPDEPYYYICMLSATANSSPVIKWRRFRCE